MDTLHNQFSGYGSRPLMLRKVFDKLNMNSEEARIEHWTQEQVEQMVEVFVQTRFPTVLSLNKIDHSGTHVQFRNDLATNSIDADQNIAKIAKKADPSTLVLTSSITEIFLRKLARQKFISYVEGEEFVDTSEDLGPDSGLREMDERTKGRVENVKDIVLYRHGSTGVVSILQKAVQLMELTPVYIVRNVQTFAHNDKNDGVFREVGLAKIGSRIGDIASSIRGGELIFIETGKTSHSSRSATSRLILCSRWCAGLGG